MLGLAFFFGGGLAEGVRVDGTAVLARTTMVGLGGITLPAPAVVVVEVAIDVVLKELPLVIVLLLISLLRLMRVVPLRPEGAGISSSEESRLITVEVEDIVRSYWLVVVWDDDE